MKRMVMVLLCLLLCGCGSKRLLVEDLQQQYAQVQKASMEAEITCYMGEANHSFTVACAYDAAEGATTTVTAPEELAGICANISGDTLTVLYEGLSLPMDSGRGVSAANCLPWLLRAAAEGYVLEYGEERLENTDCLRVALDTTAGEEKVLCTVWFDANTLVPCRAELSQDGTVVLTVKMLSFTWE